MSLGTPQIPELSAFPSGAPQPDRYYAAFAGLCFIPLFVVPAIYLLPTLATNHLQLVLVGGSWLAVGAWALLHAMSGFRVEITSEGVRRHGFFRDDCIPWAGARASNNGVLIKISNDTITISINPFVYREWRYIRRFIAQQIESATTKP